MAIKLPKELIESDYQLDASLPSPIMTTERHEDGSISIGYKYDFLTLNDYVNDIARDMNEKIESGIIAKLLTLNGYAPERTCRNESDEFCQFVCSNCEREFNTKSVYSFNYCPNCGAKVKED